MTTHTVEVEVYELPAGYNGVDVLVDVTGEYDAPDRSVGYSGGWHIIDWKIKSYCLFNADGEVYTDEPGKFREDIDAALAKWISENDSRLQEKLSEDYSDYLDFERCEKADRDREEKLMRKYGY